MSELDAHFMSVALAQAEEAAAAGEVPVGAVVVHHGEVIAVGRNRTLELNDPSAHAEVIALREAAQKLGSHRLPGLELFVTLEPCAMCSGTIFHSRLRRVVYGAADAKTGCAGSVTNLFALRALNHHTQVVGGVMEQACSVILQKFFESARHEKAKAAEPLREDALRTPESAFAALDGMALPGRYAHVADGYRMHYLDLQPEDPVATMVCIHDLPMWSYQFTPWIATLLARGYRLVLPDLLGCGLSDKPKKSSWHCVSAHAAALRSLWESLRLQPTHLVAVGKGRAIAQALVGSHPLPPLFSMGLELPRRSATDQPRPAARARAKSAVWTGPHRPRLESLDPQDRFMLEAPFPDRGYAAVLDGLRDASWQDDDSHGVAGPAACHYPARFCVDRSALAAVLAAIELRTDRPRIT